MMEDTMDQAPDLIGPVIAYRAWRTSWAGDLLRSMGIPGSSGMWKPREGLHAICHPLGCSVTRREHDAPDPDGRCGIYVMHTLDDLLAEPTQIAVLRRSEQTLPAVAGQVEVWGRSERYERGRRVEWCRVRALYRTPLAGTVDVDALAETYGVPVLEDPDGKIAAWREREPEGSGRYWHAQWPAFRQRVVTGMAANSHHSHIHVHYAAAHNAGAVLHHAVSASMATIQDYVDAMRKAMSDLAAATQLPIVAMRDMDERTQEPEDTDPDKPIPGPRKDHLQIADRNRTKGARNG